MMDKLAFWRSDPYDELAEDLAGLRGDHDAIALLPYDDGTFFFKPCNFDKDLIGGQGGYETDDGDKIVLDGDGEPVKSLMGTDVILGIDPTEHAGAVEPIKSYVAQKNNLGEWLKVDTQGNLIDVGDALLPGPDNDLDVGPTESDMVMETAGEIADAQNIREELAIEKAVEKLEQQGEITKIYDFAPPASVSANGDEVEIEQADRVAVDQSKAVDLMPTTTSTTELNTALDKARMEEYEEGKLMKYFVYGMVSASLINTIFFGIVFLMFQFF
jgi:hypothetical protein